MYLPPGPIPSSPAAHWMACNGHSWEPMADIEEKPAKLPEQIEVAYTMLRQGFTEVEIRLAIQERFGKAAKPTQAFRRGLDLVIQEQREQREAMPELVMAIRWRAIQQGLATGQLGAVAGMLRDAGAACGEAALDAAGATLTVAVLPPGGQIAAEPALAAQEASPPRATRSSVECTAA
jgi:hypothetical protein